MKEFHRFGDITQIKMGRDVPEGTHWPEGQPVLYWTAAYLVDGLLIDTGCRHTAKELADFLEGQYLKLAVNTHYHEDHVGGNAVLRDRFGIEVLASPETIEMIDLAPDWKPYREFIWGSPEPCPIGVLPECVETERYSFRVIATPGHCKGHVSLVEPTRGWCFSGDLIASTEPRVVGFEEDIDGTVASMQRILDLGIEGLALYGSAFGKVFENGCEALRLCIDYLQDLSVKVARLQKRGLPATEIRDELLGRESTLAELSDGDASSLNLIRAIMKSRAAR